MGIQAWKVFASAVILAGASSFFPGGVRKIFHSINHAVIDKDFELARVLLKDFSHRYEKEYREFRRKYKDKLPDEFFSEFPLLDSGDD